MARITMAGVISISTLLKDQVLNPCPAMPCHALPCLSLSDAFFGIFEGVGIVPDNYAKMTKNITFIKSCVSRSVSRLFTTHETPIFIAFDDVQPTDTVSEGSRFGVFFCGLWYDNYQAVKQVKRTETVLPVKQVDYSEHRTEGENGESAKSSTTMASRPER